MKQMSLTTVAIAASTFACAALLSFDCSEQRGLSLSVEKAEARVGRPLTPVSVAGVARRQHRRAAYVAGGTVVGRYGGGPNNRGGLVGGDDPGPQHMLQRLTRFGRRLTTIADQPAAAHAAAPVTLTRGLDNPPRRPAVGRRCRGSPGR